MTSHYQKACALFRKIDRFGHLANLAQWDQAAMMPEGAAAERANALAEVQTLCHQLISDPAAGEILERAGQESLDPMQAANLAEMRRERAFACALPEELVARKSLAGSRCEHAWRKQRPANDWNGFLANFKPVLEASREEAQRLSQALGLAPYDALMEKFEPGFGSQKVQLLLDSVMSWLPGAIESAISGAPENNPPAPAGPFPEHAQKELAMAFMDILGFDFSRGRLDTSAHPFCGGMANDTRITARYAPGDCLEALFAVVHETGHALYEQNLPAEWAGLPAGRARSMAVHESQSLLHEMQIGAGDPFLSLASRELRKRFGEQSAFLPENLAARARRVQPGLIRVNADELTYPAHIALRFEIEKALIEGSAQAEDIPALWDERMLKYLGADTRGNFKDGPMQDIHWTDGSFGYFPSYTLGAIAAAQIHAAIRRDLPGLDQQIENGDTSALRGWLREKIWSKGSLLSTHELIRQATGSELSDEAFRAHLTSRYAPSLAPQSARALRR